jgi:uncharacterized protein (AIM24 family)
MMRLTGDGVALVGMRPGRHVVAFSASNEIVFVREELLLAFGLELGFENGRIGRTQEDDGVDVVQLRGTGVVALDLVHEPRALDVTRARAAVVRVDALVGWTGRLVPRTLGPADAPGAMRGLVSFSGEGAVIVASR